MRPVPTWRAGLLLGALLLLVPGGARAATTVLFVGNSFTHGKYDPVRTYQAGFGPDAVHDVNCTSAATCSPRETTPPQRGTFESGPFGGIPGIVLELSREAGTPLDVSIDAVSASSLVGALKRTGPIVTDPRTGRPYDTVVLQEQSFLPLPNPNALGRDTRGDPAKFVAGVRGLVQAIRAGDGRAGNSRAGDGTHTRILLFEPQPLASYTYRDPEALHPHRAPYAGDPIEAIAADLHNSYAHAAAAVPGVAGVAFAGDAWIRAIQSGIAQRDPFAPVEPDQINLWDGPEDEEAACCATGVGYHPSRYGAYLNALVLFAALTGEDPARFGASEQAAAALGIDPDIASRLQVAARPVAARPPAPR